MRHEQKSCKTLRTMSVVGLWVLGLAVAGYGQSAGSNPGIRAFEQFAGMPAKGNPRDVFPSAGAQVAGFDPAVRGVTEDYLATYLPTWVTFGTPFVPPIPPGFFGPGSDPFTGLVELDGLPFNPSLGPTSAIIRRPGPPILPPAPPGSMGTVPIEIVALSLTSVQPIIVTYGGGNMPEPWDVKVDLSQVAPQPQGQLTAQKTHPNGGVFNSTLPVIPRFTFTRQSDLTEVVLDAGDLPVPPIQLQSANDPWVHNVNPALEVIIQAGCVWVPGVVELMPGNPTSQQVQTFDELTPDGGQSVRHTVCPARRTRCIYRATCKNPAFKGGCDGCAFTCGDLCYTETFCVDTCPNFSNQCGGPDCCVDFNFVTCNIPPPGMPLCPGPGQPCTCSPQGGACCDGQGFCTMVADECECDVLGGTYIPGATTCGPIVGCCLDDGTCQDMSQACCINRGGVPLPVGAGCSGSVEACCLPGGDCIMADPACCQFVYHGTPQGAGFACSTFFVPCCLPSGSCSFVDPLCCDDLGGTVLPAPAACDGTTQACCLPGGLCQDADRDCCIQDGGLPQGVGSSCATTNCGGGGACEPLDDGSACTQDGCSCFGECINGGYCDDPLCCLDPNDCLCYAPHAQESIKLCGDCFGECLGGSYCDDVTQPNCWINPGGAACYVPNHPVSVYLCKDCFGQCISGSYCDGPNPDCCLGGPANCQCYSPSHPISLKMCPDVDRCEARCVNYNPFTGQNIVTDCDCVGWHGCHINLPGSTDGRAAVQRGTGNPCVVNDNGGGTVTLPPVGCEYLSPDDVHAIIDGLPAGTTIELATIHKDFICHVPGEQNPVCSFPTLVDCDEAGGSLGGEKECSESNLELNMTGTGALAGFNRVITLPIGFETHVGPRTPGNPVQSFDTDMFRLFGQITNPGSGDPDFDLLRVVAGTDFGLPSPGHTTLTKLPGGPQWAVDSYFDISYRIDFVGRPGGALSGMSGSTTGTIRMATGAGPDCVGQCPPGTTCEESRVVQANGTIDICCNCVPELEEACCLPNAVGFACFLTTPANCSAQGGTPQGAGSVCLGVEACCLSNGACVDVDRVCCDDLGGIPQGVGSACEGDADGNGLDDACEPGDCAPLPDGSGCSQTGCACFGECINGGYCDAPACCLNPNDCLCYDRHAQESIKLCGDCFGECIGGSYCDDVADPTCWINPGGPACYVPSHPVSIYLCKDCFGSCFADGSYCDGPNPDCCIGGPGNCQCYSPTSPISLKMCPEVDRCEPRCARYNPFIGLTTVTDCDCVGWHGCHLDLPGGTDGLAMVQRGTGNPCVVTDNGGGTVTLPPAGCEYLSPDDVHAIIDGLPAGTTIELATIHKDFICNKQGTINPVCSFQTLVDCDEAGGSLGGEKECAESNLDIQMTGTGALAGFNRMITLPIGFETHTAPRTPGDPVQSFDTDMFRLFGQITNPGSGDPDFDLLRIVAGTDFGLPSPGHTTLTKLPGGPHWAVDSFFDITYRIDFVGRPGGPLGGMSGSTTGTIRMSTGSGLTCVGQCPPNTNCVQTKVVNADGTIDICCNCEGIPPIEEACCITNAVGTLCQMLPPAICVAQGGTPQGPGSVCQGIEACCLANGACANMDRTCCLSMGGTPRGAGSMCLGDLNGDGRDDACGCAFCQRHGDVVPQFCLIDVDDIVCVLDAFVLAPQDPPAPCSQAAADIEGNILLCEQDGLVDSTDILGILAAFVGTPNCPDPCPSGACCADFPGPPAGPECRDGSFFPGGMSEGECIDSGGTYFGDGSACPQPGCP